MRVHDLNSQADLRLGSGVFFQPKLPRRACARRSVCVCAVDGLSAAARIQRLRRQVPRRSSQAGLLLPRSILVLGICAAHVSRKLARHRNLFAGLGAQAVSRGIPRQGFAQYVGRRQRGARLADLRRLRPCPDSPGAEAVRQRTAGRRSGADGLRARLDDHRPVLESVSVGQVSPSQGRRQAAHAARPARQHSLLYSRFPRENARCQHPRPIADRAGGLLCDGSRLRRFRAAAIASRRQRPSSSPVANGISTARAVHVADVDKATGLRSDQTIVLAGPKSSRPYPGPAAPHRVLRRPSASGGWSS